MNLEWKGISSYGPEIFWLQRIQDYWKLNLTNIYYIGHFWQMIILVKAFFCKENDFFKYSHAAVNILIQFWIWSICMSFHFCSTSNWIKSGFSNKLSHMIINFEEKSRWIKSETANASRDYPLHIQSWIKMAHGGQSWDTPCIFRCRML